MNTAQRAAVRGHLAAAGFTRIGSTTDPGNGGYAESYRHDDGSSIILQWEPRTPDERWGITKNGERTGGSWRSEREARDALALFVAADHTIDFTRHTATGGYRVLRTLEEGIVTYEVVRTAPEAPEDAAREE